MRRRVVLAVTGLGLAACAQAAPSSGSAPERPSAIATTVPAPPDVMGSIVGMNVLWGDLHARGDARGIAALYTGDAVLMTPSGDVKGQAAIEAWFGRLFRERPDSILRTNTASESIDLAGDRAYEVGTIIYTVAPRIGGPARDDTVRYVMFWQLDAEGRWKIRYSLRPTPSGS